MAEPFLGQISIFGFDFAPFRWQLCRGQIMAIQQNTALFSLLGTAFGGNGTTNFGLPNMQGHVAIGRGQATGGSSYNLGEAGGATEIGLSREESPSHTHSFLATVTQATSNTPAGNSLARPQGAGSPKAVLGNLYNTNQLDTPLGVQTSAVGNGLLHDNTQPFLVLNYCICVDGIFPQRG